MATNNNSHWVEELFPPLFDVNYVECETKSLPERIDIYDVEALKNLYERIHLAVTGVGKEINVNVSKDKELIGKVDEELAELHQSVWSKDELEILRESTKNVILENKRLTARSQCHKREMKTLKDESSEIRRKYDDALKGLRVTSAANKRLSIQADSQSDEINTQRKENRCLIEKLECLNDKKIHSDNDCVKLRQKYGKLKIKSQRLVLEATEFSMLLEKEKQLLTENLTTIYEKKIGDLQRSMEEMREESESQQRIHDMTKKGLQQLQAHFAGMNG